MTSYVGLDVSLNETSICVIDDRGRIRFEGRVPSLPEPPVKSLRERAADTARIGIETGPTSAVLFRAIKAADLPVLCLETRHAHRVLSARPNKTDRNDARGLAELMRAGWYRAAWVRGASAIYVRSLLQGRRLLMQTKRTLENTLRGGVKRFGLIMSSTAGRTFTHRAASVVDRDPAYAAFAEPLLGVLRTILKQIRVYDRQLRALSRADDTAKRLMTVPGIGYLTALTFISTVEDPGRFRRSTDVGAYLGFTPRVHQSGEIERMGRITKAGDGLMPGEPADPVRRDARRRTRSFDLHDQGITAAGAACAKIVGFRGAGVVAPRAHFLGAVPVAEREVGEARPLRPIERDQVVRAGVVGPEAGDRPVRKADAYGTIGRRGDVHRPGWVGGGVATGQHRRQQPRRAAPSAIGTGSGVRCK